MKRRPAIALIVVVVFLLATALAVRWAMRPQVLGPQVLAMAGRAVGLDISAREFDYRLRGHPEIVAHGVSARVPGADTPLVEADRVLVSVPWSTLRSRGTDLRVQRVELDAPRLALEPFMAWWSQRPPGDGRMPELEDGLHVERGTVAGDGWLLRDLRLHLPRFSPDARLRAAVSGTWSNRSVEVPFNLQLAMTRPAMGAGIGAAGTVAPAAGEWRLLNRVTLSTRLADSIARAGLQLQRIRLSSAARYESGGSTQDFGLGLAANGDYADGALTLAPAALSVRGQGLVPDLDGLGGVSFGEQLAFEVAGSMRQWPATWPALPPPVGGSGAPLPFRLAYSGPADLSDQLQLSLAHGDARFQGRLRAPDVISWLGALEGDTPLPPLEGRLDVPRIDMGGATLHGVEITVDEGDPGTGTGP